MQTSNQQRPRHRFPVALLPPLLLYRIWRSSRSLGDKLLATTGALVLLTIYAGLVLAFLVAFTRLEIEWRGGYLPALTYHKSKANYDLLEAQRGGNGVPTNFPVAAAKLVDSPSDWPQFRGPSGTGVYDAEPIHTDWSLSGLPLLWKQPVGAGYSSFAMAYGRAFTLEQRREKETVVAYDLESGKELWSHAWTARFLEYQSEEGPRSTPTLNEGKVYVLGALGKLLCLAADTGQVVWERQLVEEAGTSAPKYGLAASPVVIREKLIVLTRAQGGRAVVCLEKATGKELWNAIEDKPGYATPLLVQLGGQEQLLICTHTRTAGLDLNNGAILWEYPWSVKYDQSPIAQPVVLGENRFLLSAGYFTGCAMFEIERTQTGFAARKLWESKHLKNKFTSSVHLGGFIYGLDEDTLVCLNATTGERQWKGAKYGYGQLILASGHLVILSGKGELVLVRADSASPQEVARFQAIQGKSWNHPAISAGKLLVRNGVEMACFDLRPRELTTRQP